MSFPCMDCGVDTINENYMVHDAVWDEALGGDSNAGSCGDGDLCVLCLEQRLGRKLSRQDFTDYPVNDLSLQWNRSSTLIDRLERHGEAGQGT